MKHRVPVGKQLILILLVLTFQLTAVLGQYTYDARIAMKEILTPQPASTPRINGPKIYGSRPGMKFIYRIPCQGEVPIRFKVKGLPSGLKLDDTRGVITGTVPVEKGDYVMKFKVKNAHGKDSRTLKESYGGDAEVGLKHFLQAYLACVAFVDEQIGIVVEAVNNSKFRDNTIIVLTSDHGWQMGEKDYLFKNSPWEESTRIPLIIRSPGIKAGKTVDHPVSLIDLFPTLTDLCGLKGDNRKNESGGKIDGFSLRPFLIDPETSKWNGPDGALSMVGVGLDKEDVLKQTYSYRTRDWRYILYMDGTEELYDHRNDPYEWKNLAGQPDYLANKQALKEAMLEIVKGSN